MTILKSRSSPWLLPGFVFLLLSTVAGAGTFDYQGKRVEQSGISTATAQQLTSLAAGDNCSSTQAPSAAASGPTGRTVIRRTVSRLPMDNRQPQRADYTRYLGVNW